MGYYSSVQYSLIVRFTQILVYSSFLVKKQYGHQTQTVEEAALFHTIPFTSLQPASFCTGSTKRQSSALEVIHRHGPCFSKKTKPKPLSEILAHDQSRVDAIQARLNPTPNPNSNQPKHSKTPTKDPFNDTKVNLPAQPGRSFSTGNYVVTIRLGTPEKALSLIFDTGSDLTWTQCQPCARSCYNQQDPIFDPSASSSYSNISCTSTECSRVGPATGIRPGCSASTCLYGLQYGDRSYSVGFFCKDKLTITPPDDVFPDFLFGCGQKNQGLFGYTAGILGLGRDPLSAVSQTASKYENYFSYCLPSISSLTGHLAFGKNSNHVNDVKFTPFAGSQLKPYYFVNIVSVYVGGTQVAIDESVFQAAGSIIDSGTVITRLPPAAYGPMSSAFRQLMTSYTQTEPYSLLDTCYDFGNSTSITIPKVSFGFGGDVVVELAAPGILVVVGPSKACLAFAGNGRDTDVGIFGNTQQKTLEVVYDVAGGKLGFGAGGCK